MILMTDDARLPNPEALLDRLPKGSAVVVRARDPRVLRRRALALRSATRRRGLKLLIANDWRLAHAVQADGIHLSEASWRKKAPYWRRHARPQWIITAACHRQSFPKTIVGVHAVLISPVFPTKSHGNGEALGVIRFGQISGHCPYAVYPMGGVSLGNQRRLFGWPLAGIAGISVLD